MPEAGPVAVGIDIGGTTTAAALVGPGGATGPVHTLPTPASAGPARVLDAAADLTLRVTAHPDATGPVHAVGVGTAGVVDVPRGTIISATEAIADWPGTDVAGGLADRLRAHLGAVPVHVQNDVDAHAAGETWVGAAAGVDHVLMVAAGTGVGGAVVVDGRPLRGAHHLAGEMGHIPTPGAEGLRCACGRPGHLEAIASGPGLLRHYRRLGGAGDCADARAVVARAADDDLAARAVTDAAEALGRAIAGICTVLDPAAVVIGGGLAGAGPLWWDAMERAVRAEVVEPLADLPLLPAVLAERAAIIGAVRPAWPAPGQQEEGP